MSLLESLFTIVVIEGVSLRGSWPVNISHISQRQPFKGALLIQEECCYVQKK
jgi:hypothetical protein